MYVFDEAIHSRNMKGTYLGARLFVFNRYNIRFIRFQVNDAATLLLMHKQIGHVHLQPLQFAGQFECGRILQLARWQRIGQCIDVIVIDWLTADRAEGAIRIGRFALPCWQFVLFLLIIAM